ncbi:MAG: Do family serine endopeptidase [Alphaproteobacteria bacterium]|nr:Do family serine endopeptidase [Alphaproteobacteria bacterium]
MRLTSLFVVIFSLLCLCSFGAKAQTALPDFTVMVENLMPTVVNITTEIDRTTVEQEEMELLNEATQESKHTPAGSGFIISQDGYVVTNKHVIDDAVSIKATTYDNKTYDAKIIGIDEKTDIALLKILPQSTLKPVVFGDSDNTKVGEWVLAIGNPFGLGGSVTKGIISAKSRDIESGNYDDFLQTDASINRGNSGGPMFNMNEEIIGINSAIFSTTGGSMGIGFAIPINLAKWVIEQLKENGEVKRGWIGVKIQANNSQIALSLGLKENQGIIISGFSESAPAQKAGLMAGDVILSFDGVEIDNTKSLSRLVAETKIGKKVKVDYWRGKKRFSTMMLVEEMPKVSKKEEKKISETTEQDLSFIKELGISLAVIDDEKISQYALPKDVKGLVITQVISQSDAANKGLIAGDVIVKIDKKDLFTLEDMKKNISDAKRENNRPILLLVQSKETVNFVALKLRKE